MPSITTVEIIRELAFVATLYKEAFDVYTLVIIVIIIASYESEIRRFHTHAQVAEQCGTDGHPSPAGQVML